VRQAGSGGGVPGRERFFHFLFNAKSCHKCFTSTPGICAASALPLLAPGLPDNPYIRTRLVILWS
jgi:hypothetical protein